jgi:membrane protease YdiL (CAAX protease family)
MEQVLSWWYLLFVGAYMPWVIVRRALRPPPTEPPTLASGHAVRRMATQSALFGVIAILTAAITGVDLLATGTLDWRATVLAVAVMALAWSTIPLRVRLTPPDRRARILRVRPQRPADLPGWFVLSLSAGVFEEIVFRGVMFALVQRLTGDWTSATFLCVLSFTVGHAVQGWAGMVAVAVLAFCLHVIVRMTGSLYPAMAMHFVYDFVAGLVYLRLNRMSMAGEGELTGRTVRLAEE